MDSRFRRASASHHRNSHREQYDNEYDSNRILQVKPSRSIEVDFSDEPSYDVACEKQFLFSLFYDYIKYNVVRVKDLAVMYKDVSQDLKSKDLDILSFLMATDKFEFVKEESNSKKSLNKSFHKSKTPSSNCEEQTSHYASDLKSSCELDSQPYLDSTLDLLSSAYDSLLEDDDDDDGSKFEESSFDLSPSANDASSNKGCKQKSSYFETPSDGFEKLYNEERLKNERLLKENDELKSGMRRMSEKCTVLEKEIDLRDAQLERYENELKMFAEIVDEIAQFKLKHEDLLEERLILKQEIVDLLNANKTLEEKLSNQSLVPKSKKQEIVSLFREEYKILQERIDSEWKEKLEKQLEESKKALDTQVHFKMELMKTYLNAQYIGNKYLIAGHVAQCYTALEILTGVNNWMQQTMGFPVVTDASTWITRLSILQKIEADQETEYSKLVACLNCDATQKLQLFDVTLKKPEFPAAPNQTLGSIMRNVLTALYNDQRAIIQHLMRESISQRMAQNRALPYDFGSHSSSGWGTNTPIPRTQGIDNPSRVLVQALQNTGISHPHMQQQHSANYSNAPSSISLVSASSSQSSRKSSLSEQLCFSAKSSTNSSIASDPVSQESKIVGETALNRKDDYSVEETNSIGKVILARGDSHWTDDAPTKTDSNSTEECDDTSEAWARLASQIDKLA